jgi:hypothetical protein
MFPTVRCSFQNLRPDRKYWVLLDVVPCDNKRYRYAYHRSSWLVAGKADPPPPHRFYPHPDAPYTGEQLRKQVVSFEKIKLTNNELDKTGQVSRDELSELCMHGILFSPLLSSPRSHHVSSHSRPELSLGVVLSVEFHSLLGFSPLSLSLSLFLSLSLSLSLSAAQSECV